jgi:tripartite-type tricarboxylate transporter receptor subunit TctC
VVVAAIRLLVLFVLPLAALAQETFPAKPIRLIVSFPPGAGADITARVVAQKMSERMKQPIVVENRAGANGSVGAAAVASAPPDGYTLLLTDRGALGINPSLYRTLPYDPLKDFAYVGIVTVAPYVLVAHPKLGAATFAELVALAKANPGKINYASFGMASMAQLNIEALKARLGIDLVHVPYKGGAPAVQAVVSGDAGVTVASPAGVLGFVRDGRLRPLAIGSPKRSPLLPDVPTLAEVGAGEDTMASTYFAFALPAGTARPIVERLHRETADALAQPDLAERLSAAGLEPAGSSGEELLQLVRKDIPRFRKLIDDIGIKPE